MGTAVEYIQFVMNNWQMIGGILLAIVGVLEMVVRLTPTLEDDGWVERLGAGIRKLLDFARIPNVKKLPKA